MDTKQGPVSHAHAADLNLGLQDVIDGLQDEFFIVDTEYRVKFVNSTLREKSSQEEPAIIGKHCYRVFQNRDKPCDAPLWRCPLQEVLKTNKPVTLTYCQDVDETGVCGAYISVSLYPLKDTSGNLCAVAELRKNVTAQRQLDNETLKHYHQLSALSQISTAVSGLWDLDTILQVALDNSLNIMNGNIGGILLLDEQTQTLSYRVHRGLSERYVQEILLNVGQGIAGRVAETGDPILLEDISLDPRTVHTDVVSTEGLKAFISVPLRAKERVLGVINVASRLPHSFKEDDMHLLSSIGDQIGMAIEQARLYDQLSKERENYRRLARHMLVAQEKERARVARELHDETTQSLTGLSLTMQALVNIAKTSNFGDEEFNAKLKEAHNISTQLGAEVSRIMKGLRPTVLDSLGLPPAIRQYAENRLQPLGINVSLTHEGNEERLPTEAEFALFRIAQGIIANIALHSQASNAWIDIRRVSNDFVMEIKDDGKGFDSSRPIEVDETGRGRGLFSMNERATLLGGTCDIQSRPGKGTTITVRVPVYWSKSDAKDKGFSSG
ncbi:MAG: GAF domain-containing protein [Chloroflexota bacterium]